MHGVCAGIAGVYLGGLVRLDVSRHLPVNLFGSRGLKIGVGGGVWCPLEPFGGRWRFA